MVGREERLRLLFDEQMSTNVARALACLGKSVTYVGDVNQPPRGSSDLIIAQAAKRQKRVLATFNFDMVLTACEVGIRFVWFDQRGRSPSKLETAFIFLRQWDTWERHLANPAVECLKVGREAVEELTIEEARKRAERRFRDTKQTQISIREKHNRSQQTLLSFDDDD